MAIFGLFGKKGNQPAPAEKDPARVKRSSSSSTAKPSAESSAERAKQGKRNVARAQDTAKKIDAIESEMSSEFSPSTINSGASESAIVPARPAKKDAAQVKSSKDQPQTTIAQTDATLPSMGVTTEFLLGEEGKTVLIEVGSSETAQVIEEAAILYANEQYAMAEQLLSDAVLDEDLNRMGKTAWWMLFDLYQITGKQQQFENLSIEYASKFETSPPAWVGAAPAEVNSAPTPQRKGATPAVVFTGKLDGSIIKLLERVQKFSESSKVLRLEFAKIDDVDPVGCGLLLRTLQKLQKSEHDLVLVGAAELLAKIRSILQVGRRDETEAPWLLMLELMRLLNQEQEFEEASIDYCITFEVSPPAFVAPQNKVTTALEETASIDAASDNFMMPAVIDAKVEPLLESISSFVAAHNLAILDCSRLNRVDFTAAGQLMSHLAPLCCGGKSVELHNVNHLIYALFSVMGLKDVVPILPRKL